MIGQVVVSYEGSLHLIAKAMADIIVKSNRRTLISQGLANQYILKHFGVEDTKNIKGYVSKKVLTSCNENRGTYIISNSKAEFVDNSTFKQMKLFKEDIVLKGGNALYFNRGEYSASVLSASPDLGTYKNIYMKAIAVSADVFIPISMDKFVPNVEKSKWSHKEIDIVMGDFSVIELPLFYGKIFTELDALKYLYKLKATLFSKGSSDAQSIEKVFIVEGAKQDIKNVITFLQKHN